MTHDTPRPIHLVTFDLYDTLIEIYPSRWERLGFALDKLGVSYDLDALNAADVIAEDFYTEENAGTPIRDRSRADQELFRVAYMRRWLEAAGMEVTDELARQARAGYRAELPNCSSKTKIMNDVPTTISPNGMASGIWSMPRP